MIGPVFRLEMTAGARARRTYGLRVLVGLALLAYVGASYHDAFPDPSAGPARPSDVSTFARHLFRGLAAAQGLAVVLLAPALAAGAVAGEAQRKTLDDLLTSGLTAAEVVADKAMARLLQVAALLLAGLPVTLVAADLGGDGPAMAVGALGAACCTAVFLAGLALVASTLTRSVRGALNATLTIGLAWLIVPAAIEVLLPRAGAVGFALFPWVEPVNAWAAASSPFAVGLRLARGGFATADAFRATVAWMVGLQLAGGVGLVAAAAALLRPAARVGGLGNVGRRRAGPARPEIPPCGDDPMLWKELIVPRVPAFYRPVALVTGLVLGGLVVASTLGFAARAAAEAVAFGYGVAPVGSDRADFLLYLRVVATGVAAVYLLGVASDAAASLTSERERDTWISLVATPLTGAEIVRAKGLGAFWGIRHTLTAFAGLVALGVVAGSIHPVSVPLVAAALAGPTALAAAIGLQASLRSGATTRALSATMLALVALNASGLALALVPGLPRPIAWAGCAPLAVAEALASPGDLAGVPSWGRLGRLTDSRLSDDWAASPATVVAALTLGAGLQGFAAWLLYRRTCRTFDAALDRPAVEPPIATMTAPGFPDAVPSGFTFSGPPRRSRRPARSAPAP